MFALFIILVFIVGDGCPVTFLEATFDFQNFSLE